MHLREPGEGLTWLGNGEGAAEAGTARGTGGCKGRTGELAKHDLGPGPMDGPVS